MEYRAEKIDRLLELESGCCKEACENGWVESRIENGQYLVKEEGARKRWAV